MKINHFKVIVIILLSVLVMTYTNCGKPFGPPTALVFSGNMYGGSEASYKAFEQTVYPLTRANCASCHSSTQPLHAATDMRVAHDAVVSQFKVNFANIPASRLVAKLRDEHHNCWGNCAENAQEMQRAIESWDSAIETSGNSPETPAPQAIYTDETMPMEMEFNDPSNPLKSNTFRLTIESAMLKTPMQLARPAGSEAYLSVPTTTNTTLANTDVNAGMAYFNFVPPTSGSYRLFGLVHGPVDADNSFYVNIVNTKTNASVGGIRQWDIPVSSNFDWRQVPGTATLVAGTNYTIQLRQREDGTRLAGFIMTADTAFNGQEVDDFFGITLAFDLSEILDLPNVKLLIDVIDYDPYSYKFSKPRIVTPTSNVYVKGLKLYVNDVFSPQHSTYTIIDKTVTPTDPILSTSSMIVLKDQGPAKDVIRFSFDELALTTGTGGTTGGNTGGGVPASSLGAYQSTVYPISRSSAYTCMNCHRGTSPRHAADDPQTAHDAALTVVDFATPENSRIVRKMRVERHNCGANCDSIATAFENAIREWKTRRQ